MRATRRALALALLGAWPLAADLLIETSGQERLGTLSAIEGGKVYFSAEAGGVTSLPLAGVARLELHRDLSGTRVRNLGGLDDPILKESLEYVAGPDEYPGAGAVNLYLGHRVVFEPDWSARTRVRNVVRVLKERGKAEGTVRGGWLRDLEEWALEFGRTFLPDGRIEGLTDKGVRIAPQFGGMPEYDRKMRQVSTLPAVDVGRVVDWQSARLRKGGDPFQPPFYSQVLSLTEPVINGEVVLRIPKDLDAEVVLTKTQGVLRHSRLQGNHRVETFRFAGFEPPPSEDSVPPAEELFPTIFCAPRSSWTTISQAMLEPVAEAAKAGPRAQALLAELVPPGTDLAKVYEILALWVAREVRLAPVLMDDFSYRPRALEDVLATRRGNYLDKTLALFGLLKAAGVGTELYLVRDRYAGAFPPRVTSLRLFDDAVLKVNVPGQGWVWRDPDDDDLGPGSLTPSLHGVQALRVSGDTPSSALETIPEPPLDADRVEIELDSTLDPEGRLAGAWRMRPFGASESLLRPYRRLAKDQLDKRMEEMAHSFHPSAELAGYTIENAEDFTRPISLERRLAVPGYALRAGGKLLAFRMPGLKDNAADVGLPVRRFPMAFQARELQTRDLEVRLPKGAKLLHLPGKLEIEGKGYRFKGSFSREGDLVRYASRYERSAWRIAPEDYPAYKRMRDERARQALEWVVLELP